jgi:hypothetical protein
MILVPSDPRCQTGAKIQLGSHVYQVVGMEAESSVNYGRLAGLVQPGLFVTSPDAGDVTWISAESVATSWVLELAPACPDTLDEAA